MCGSWVAYFRRDAALTQTTSPPIGKYNREALSNSDDSASLLYTISIVH